jgi:hypothetical protein
MSDNNDDENKPTVVYITIDLFYTNVFLLTIMAILHILKENPYVRFLYFLISCIFFTLNLVFLYIFFRNKNS